MLAMNDWTVQGLTQMFFQATQFKGIVTLQIAYTLRIVSMAGY